MTESIHVAPNDPHVRGQEPNIIVPDKCPVLDQAVKAGLSLIVQSRYVIQKQGPALSKSTRPFAKGLSSFSLHPKIAPINACATGLIGEHHQIPGEIRRVCAAGQRHEHAIIPCHWDNLHICDDRRTFFKYLKKIQTRY